MLHFYDRATMAHALTLDVAPDLHGLLADRIGALGEDLIDWTELLIVEPGDTEEQIVNIIGFSPLVSPIDGSRWPEPEFEPCWDWLADQCGCFEMIVTFGSTFACVLLIADQDGVPSDLRQMCRSLANNR